LQFCQRSIHKMRCGDILFIVFGERSPEGI
jgi:hypothetical protein